MRPIEMLAAAARLLEPLGVRVVFIGGASVGLHLEACRSISPTHCNYMFDLNRDCNNINWLQGVHTISPTGS